MAAARATVARATAALEASRNRPHVSVWQPPEPDTAYDTQYVERTPPPRRAAPRTITERDLRQALEAYEKVLGQIVADFAQKMAAVNERMMALEARLIEAAASLPP